VLSSSVQAYSDPAQLEDAYLVTKAQLTPTGHEPFEARVVRVQFDALWVMQTYERAPRIKHAEQTPSRTFIKFLAQPGQELVMQGSVLPYDSIVRHPQGHSYYERTAGEVHWAGISMPVDDLEAATIAVRGCGLAPLHNRMIVVPTFQAMTRLRQLHGSIAAMAANAPGTLTAPEVAHGLEQSLIEAIVGCLSGPEEHEATWAQRCHETIMRRFFRLLEENPTRPIFVPEFCSAIRVPERTLRACCQEHFGMGPKQYLLLRRMTLAHRALQSANPVETTVTEVATRFGFWHFGRFAGEYRALFGEAPSVTLGALKPRGRTDRTLFPSGETTCA
jgi:AraC-like DNA-binding protein